MSLNEPVIKKIYLDKFKPRPFQAQVMDALFLKGYKKILSIIHRKSGKDVGYFNIMLLAALQDVGNYLYVAPTFAQCRGIIWDYILNDGTRMLDFIPPELIARKNEHSMKLYLGNGSTISMAGSKNFDNSLVGQNPKGVVFTEFFKCDPRAYTYIRPALTANKGWVMINSTPRGKANHLYDLYEKARISPSWYVQHMGVRETGLLTEEDIQREREDGFLTEDEIQQEFYCSWERGSGSAFYDSYINQAELEERIGRVPWDPAHPVNSSWDMGMDDDTCIVFWQNIGQTIRIIDSYSNRRQGIPHYARYILSKPYTYGTHVLPHDARVQEMSGYTRKEQLAQLGINSVIAPNIPLLDGIDNARTKFNRVWIDLANNRELIKSLRSYRQEWDDVLGRYKPTPVHDKYCFEENTLLLTQLGMRRIIDIQENDLILTETGWYPCKKAQKTGINASLVEVTFKDGTKVKCTPEHRFLTENGWKSAEHLTNSTKIQSSLMKLHNTLQEDFISYGRERDMLLEAVRNSTETSGNLLSEIFQRIHTSIIKTIIPLTINYPTSNACPDWRISESLVLITRDFLRLQEMLQKNGINQQKEDCGISARQIVLNLEKEREKAESAYFALKISKDWLEAIVRLKSFVTQIAKPLIIESVAKLQEKADVYCINVPDIHHFSLSNGALVHNSHYADAFRYMMLKVDEITPSVTGEQLERAYLEAQNYDPYRPQWKNFPDAFNS